LNCLFVIPCFWNIANLSNGTETTDPSTKLNEKITLQTDKFIHYLAEKLPEIFIKLQIGNSSSISTDEIVKQKKLILSNLLRDYLQRISHVQASTQVIGKENDTKSYTFFCSTSTNT